jgi:hypothetical protein
MRNTSKVIKAATNKQAPTSNLFDYNAHVDEEKDRVYIYLGDELGYLKIWCLDHIVEEFNIKRADRYIDIIGRDYNPYRKEQVDCSDYVNALRESGDSNPKLPDPVEPNKTGMLIREIKGHNQAVNCLDKIDLSDLTGFISCSKDRKILTWTLGLDVLGKLNQVADEREDPRWLFPSEVKKIMEIKEVERLQEIVQ